MERCRSGRTELPAKQLIWATGSQGSNPCLSANFFLTQKIFNPKGREFFGQFRKEMADFGAASSLARVMIAIAHEPSNPKGKKVFAYLGEGKADPANELRQRAGRVISLVLKNGPCERALPRVGGVI